MEISELVMECLDRGPMTRREIAVALGRERQSAGALEVVLINLARRGKVVREERVPGIGKTYADLKWNACK